MARFYIDNTTTANNYDVPLAGDLRDGERFRAFTDFIFRAVRRERGITISGIKREIAKRKKWETLTDADYWLTMALHDLKAAGRIAERGILITRFEEVK